jgi:hypothetical protein
MLLFFKFVKAAFLFLLASKTDPSLSFIYFSTISLVILLLVDNPFLHQFQGLSINFSIN